MLILRDARKSALLSMRKSPQRALRPYDPTEINIPHHAVHRQR
jgi:hypothetical protein